MRWSLSNVLILVLIIGLALGVYRVFWLQPNALSARALSGYYNSRTLFTVYLAILTTASIAAWQSRPRWRRLWLGYTVFGWTYLALMLRGGFGFTPDVYASNLSRFSLLGILMGVICALAVYLLPGLREPGANDRRDPPFEGF